MSDDNQRDAEADDDGALRKYVESLFFQHSDTLTKQDFECVLLEVCEDPRRLSSELAHDIFREVALGGDQDKVTAPQLTGYVRQIEPHSCLYRADVVSDRVFMSWSVWSCFLFIAASITSVVANVSKTRLLWWGFSVWWHP